MKHKPYRYLFYLGLRLLQAVVLWMPREVALALARGIGGLAFFIARRERKRTLSHLSYAFGEEKKAEEIRELGRKVFMHYAHVAADVLRFPRLTREAVDQLVEGHEGLSVFDRVLREGRGAILLSAHLGNWELMGAFLRFHGYPGALVGRRIYYEKFNQVLLDLRSKVTLKTLYQDASPREFVRVLNQNQILGILADQDVDRFDGIFVPFFGRPTYTLTTPVKLALATGAPLLPAFVIRSGKRYRFLVEEPIYVQMRMNKEETIREYTERWSQVIEAKIRAYPDQWVWTHRRWKTQPPPAEVPQTVIQYD